MSLTKYQFIKLAGHWQVPAKGYKDSVLESHHQCHKDMAQKTWGYIHRNTSHVRDLLNQVSHDNYGEKLKQFEINWSQAFHQYYMDVIHSEVNT